MDWESHLEKNPIKKIEKNSKNQSEILVKYRTEMGTFNFLLAITGVQLLKRFRITLWG